MTNRRPNTVCDLCQKPIYRRPFNLARQAGKFCSRACRNRAHPLKGPRPWARAMRGPANPAWKGGVTYKRPKGNYIGPRYVRCPPEFLPMARRDGYIMEHRLVIAKALGRLLTRTEVVHHRNHNPRDNRPENLELFASNGEHKRAEAAALHAAA